MSLKIDSSNERSLLPQNQDEQIIKKEAAVQIGISSYESQDVGNNFGEEIWRPDGTKKFLHPILGDRWGRVQTASTTSKDDDTYFDREIPSPPDYGNEPGPPPHDRETFCREPHCKEPTPPYNREPYSKAPPV